MKGLYNGVNPEQFGESGYVDLMRLDNWKRSQTMNDVAEVVANLGYIYRVEVPHGTDREHVIGACAGLTDYTQQWTSARIIMSRSETSFYFKSDRMAVLFRLLLQ